MKKIINKPENVVTEMLDGLAYVHSDLVHRVEGFDIIARNEQAAGQVGLISGGGSGHEPAHAGFVGDGMLSAAIAGAVFTSPTPDQILEAIKEADQGAGVFMVVKNYSGDVMNFEMAIEMAADEDIKADYVVVNDDVAVRDSLYTTGRRGVAGTILSYIISFGMNNMTMIVYGLNTLLMKLGINATIDLSSLMGSSDSMYYGGGMYMSDSGSGTVMSIIPIWLVLAAIGFAVVGGLLSGIVPASRAVRISALEAIRHD